MVLAEFPGDLRNAGGAFVRVVSDDRPDFVVVGFVGVGLGAIARESDQFAVRRPERLAVVKVTIGYLLERFGSDVENIKMGTMVVEIANRIRFKQQPIDHPRLLRLGFLGRFIIAIVVLVGGGLEFFFSGIAKDENQTSAIGRPTEGLDVLRGFGQTLRFST